MTETGKAERVKIKLFDEIPTHPESMLQGDISRRIIIATNLWTVL